jgi:hypothetical protein
MDKIPMRMEKPFFKGIKLILAFQPLLADYIIIGPINLKLIINFDNEANKGGCELTTQDIGSTLTERSTSSQPQP